MSERPTSETETVLRLRELVARRPEIPLWSHSANYWIYNGEQFADGTIADHRWLQDLSRWSDEVAALETSSAGGDLQKRIAQLEFELSFEKERRDVCEVALEEAVKDNTTPSGYNPAQIMRLIAEGRIKSKRIEELKRALAAARGDGSGREAALDEVVFMLQGMQSDAVNRVDRGNVIDRVRGLKRALAAARGDGSAERAAVPTGAEINARYGHAPDCLFGRENSGFCSCSRGFGVAAQGSAGAQSQEKK